MQLCERLCWFSRWVVLTCADRHKRKVSMQKNSHQFSEGYSLVWHQDLQADGPFPLHVVLIPTVQTAEHLFRFAGPVSREDLAEGSSQLGRKSPNHSLQLGQVIWKVNFPFILTIELCQLLKIFSKLRSDCQCLLHLQVCFTVTNSIRQKHELKVICKLKAFLENPFCF